LLKLFFIIFIILLVRFISYLSNEYKKYKQAKEFETFETDPLLIRFLNRTFLLLIILLSTFSILYSIFIIFSQIKIN
jgi:hypothetical protein